MVTAIGIVSGAMMVVSIESGQKLPLAERATTLYLPGGKVAIEPVGANTVPAGRAFHI
jgi:hypothetical protein